MGQFGILAQLCDVQGVPSSISIIGVVMAVTAADASWTGATVIVASVSIKPKILKSLLIVSCVPGSGASHNTQFAERSS